VIIPPAQETFGRMSREALRGAPFREWDLSMSKKVRFTERLSAQFRAEFLTFLNSREYAAPGFPILTLACPQFSPRAPRRLTQATGLTGPAGPARCSWA
jgi:hypothetical protein